MAHTRPNIVLIATDQQRYDTLGVRGLTPCKTPTWDRVAAEGACFENARTPCPLCQPARAALFTGCYPHRAGIGHETNFSSKTDAKAPPMGLEALTVQEHLRAAGYQVLHTGKWQLSKGRFDRYFDDYAGCEQGNVDYIEWCRAEGCPIGKVFIDPDHSMEFRSPRPPHMSLPKPGVSRAAADKMIDAWVTMHAHRLLEQRDPDRPFFMSVCLHGPHPPYVVPQQYFDMYDPADVVKPANWGPMPGEPSFLDTSYFRQIFYDYEPDFEKWRKTYAVYWGFVTFLDDLMGRLIDRLDELVPADNTLLVMTSDHGDMIGSHGLVQKMCPYQECLRVPLVVRWPGRVAPDTRLAVDVSHIDIAPTVLSAAGVDIEPLGLDGENLTPYLTGEQNQPPVRDVFSGFAVSPIGRQYHHIEPWYLLLRRPWSYTWHANGETELYQLDDDPSETRNLSAEAGFHDTAAQLHAALQDWIDRTDAPFDAVQPNATA